MSFGRQLELGLQTTEAPRPAATPDARKIEQAAREALRELGHHSLATRVTVRWSRRLTTTAGLAQPGRGVILLNPRIVPYGTAELDRTWRHELAHLLAHHLAAGRRIAAHGREWRKACTDLGIPDEKRCHALPLPRRVVPRPHVYFCPVCASELRRVRPFRTRVACASCCRHMNRGKYDERFRLVKRSKAVVS